MDYDKIMLIKKKQWHISFGFRAAHFSPAGFRSDTNVESDYPGYFQEHVDKCNSCVYSAGASSKTQSMSKGSVKRVNQKSVFEGKRGRRMAIYKLDVVGS